MRFFLSLFFFLIILGLNVNALAVASDFLENNTLELIEEQSTLYGIRLQNPTDNEVKVKLGFSSEIANVINYKEIYTLPPKKLDTSIFFNITAPEYAKIGDTFSVRYSVEEVGSSGTGPIPIGVKINKHFNVKIIEDPNKLHINWFYVGVVIILILVIIYLLRKKR